METPVSFAPLAARLAAHAAKIRPAHGARNDWDKIGALLVCLVLEMLIALCEALDARAAAEAASITASAPRAGRHALQGEKRAPRLALAPYAKAEVPSRAAAPSGTIERPAPASPRLVWSRDYGPSGAVLAPSWRPRRETELFHPRPSTRCLLRYRN